MTTTITLPDDLAQRLRQQASARHRSADELAREYLAAALTEAAVPATADLPARADDPELLALVARIKAMPKDPRNIIPAKGNLAEVLRSMAHGEPDQEVLDALVAAERELNAINRADDIAEGRA